MFDEQPDGDPHGECAAEIHRLTKLLTKIAECTHGDPSRKRPAQRGKWVTVMMRPELLAEIEQFAPSVSIASTADAIAEGLPPL